MASFYAWQVDRAAGLPVYRQIYRQIRAAILSRTLGPGAKLPSTRELAGRLTVARATVVAAYEQLLAEGYISRQVGAGSYVSADLPELLERRLPRRSKTRTAKAPQLSVRGRDFAHFAASTAQSDERPFNTDRTLVDARTRETWRKLTNQTLRSFDPSHLGCSDTRGFIELRETLGAYLKVARGVECDPDQIIITAGTYGYASGKAQIARAVGRTLAEQVVELQPDFVVCDSETCRWSIERSTGRRTLHPIELLCAALVTSQV